MSTSPTCKQGFVTEFERDRRRSRLAGRCPPIERPTRESERARTAAYYLALLPMGFTMQARAPERGALLRTFTAASAESEGKAGSVATSNQSCQHAEHVAKGCQLLQCGINKHSVPQPSHSARVWRYVSVGLSYPRGRWALQPIRVGGARTSSPDGVAANRADVGETGDRGHCSSGRAFQDERFLCSWVARLPRPAV